MKRSMLGGLALCALLAGCGGSSQGLPSASNAGIPAGYMRITLDVAGPLDFSRYQYAIVLNTRGNGLTPEFGSLQTQWPAYSDELRVTGESGQARVEVVQYVPNKNPHLPPAQVALTLAPQQLRFDSQVNGNGTALSITFERSALGGHSMKIADTWEFNAASLDAKGVVESMGSCDTCFNSPSLDVDTRFDRTINAASGGGPASARIVSVELANQP